MRLFVAGECITSNCCPHWNIMLTTPYMTPTQLHINLTPGPPILFCPLSPQCWALNQAVQCTVPEVFSVISFTFDMISLNIEILTAHASTRTFVQFCFCFFLVANCWLSEFWFFHFLFRTTSSIYNAKTISLGYFPKWQWQFPNSAMTETQD